jgi:hypothetical protein
VDDTLGSKNRPVIEPGLSLRELAVNVASQHGKLFIHQSSPFNRT